MQLRVDSSTPDLARGLFCAQVSRIALRDDSAMLEDTTAPQDSRGRHIRHIAILARGLFHAQVSPLPFWRGDHSRAVGNVHSGRERERAGRNNLAAVRHTV